MGQICAMTLRPICVINLASGLFFYYYMNCKLLMNYPMTWSNAYTVLFYKNINWKC